MKKDISDNSEDVLLGTIEIIISDNNTRVTKVYAATKETGRKKLAKDDEYFINQSRFDRESRISISNGLVDDEKLKELYVSYVVNQIQSWSADEISSLKTIVKNMNYKYKLLTEFKLPTEIYIVKTSGYEEGAAAYTRQLDTIVIPANMSASLSDFQNNGDPLHPSGNTEYLEGIITHESFHVFSKNSYVNDKKHLSALYKNIGFNFTEKAVALPNVPWPNADSTTLMPDFKITNPDSPMENTYVELNIEGEGIVPLMPLLIADKTYDGGAFFEYLGWYLVRIEDESGTWKVKMDSDNRPVMYNMNIDSALMNEYLKLIGYNLTDEIFQADEVLAQSFVLLLQQKYPSQWVLDDLLSKI